MQHGACWARLKTGAASRANDSAQAPPTRILWAFGWGGADEMCGIQLGEWGKSMGYPDCRRKSGLRREFMRRGVRDIEVAIREISFFVA